MLRDTVTQCSWERSEKEESATIRHNDEGEREGERERRGGEEIKPNTFANHCTKRLHISNITKLLPYMWRIVMPLYRF